MMAILACPLFVVEYERASSNPGVSIVSKQCSSTVFVKSELDRVWFVAPRLAEFVVKCPKLELPCYEIEQVTKAPYRGQTPAVNVRMVVKPSFS